jgi:DNA-binding winged helix-turn-helix (wHTH) protein
MKIILNTQSSDILNYFLKASKNSVGLSETKKVEVDGSRVESHLLDSIGSPSVDAYLIEVPSSYSKKAVDFIKKKTPYIPVILFGSPEALTEVSGADIYIPLCSNSEDFLSNFYKIATWNAFNYTRNFEKLRKLTTKMSEVIEFNNCKYDPTRRTLFYKGNEVKRLSAKEGGIIEILASNFGEVVKKEVILEKVWHKSDYFSGRSMDVYVTHLRNLLKESDIDVNIKNISGVGLILE